jgi:hypothetical protein
MVLRDRRGDKGPGGGFAERSAPAPSEKTNSKAPKARQGENETDPVWNFNGPVTNISMCHRDRSTLNRHGR